MDTCIMDTSAWVTRPERPKGVKDEVKEAQRLEVGSRRAPKLLVLNIALKRPFEARHQRR